MSSCPGLSRSVPKIRRCADGKQKNLFVANSLAMPGACVKPPGNKLEPCLSPGTSLAARGAEPGRRSRPLGYQPRMPQVKQHTGWNRYFLLEMSQEQILRHCSTLHPVASSSIIPYNVMQIFVPAGRRADACNAGRRSKQCRSPVPVRAPAVFGGDAVPSAGL